MKKRGFFFSLDAFLAIVLFTIVLTMIYTFFIQFSPLQQQYYFSEDLLEIYSNVKIEELDLGIYPNIQILITNGKITDTSLTIIEQIERFDREYDETSIESMMRDIYIGLLPEQYGHSLELRDIYGEDPEGRILSRQRLIFVKED